MASTDESGTGFTATKTPLDGGAMPARPERAPCLVNPARCFASSKLSDDSLGNASGNHVNSGQKVAKIA